MLICKYKILLVVSLSLICAKLGAQLFNTDMSPEYRLAMRAIGHEVLLSAGDSNSRVLSIQKVQGRYQIDFENDFAFYPENVRHAIDQTFPKTGFKNGYLVEIENCQTHSVVYSYSMGYAPMEDLAPCSGRLYPKNCYILFISLGADTKRAENINTLDTLGADSGANNSQFLLVLFLVFAGAGIVGFFFWNRKKQKPSIETDLIPLGQFRFDRKNMLLLHEGDKIELSAKEADLLFLLYSSENKTLERDSILKVVWGNQGDYVGRTLDVFISKLRKKLAADDSLKIINIRGVGYKFVMNSA